MRFAFKIHLIKTAPVPASHRNSQAFWAFHLLGDAGKSAVPELIQILDENISDSSRRGTCLALGMIGPGASNAVPALVKLATNRPRDVQNCALDALTRIHAPPDLVVPLLMKAMTDPDANTRGLAIIWIREFGTNATPAVPQLVASLKDPDPSVQECARAALKQIDPEAAAKAGIQ